MKSTNKITLTIGQLKRLIKESKSHKNFLKEAAFNKQFSRAFDEINHAVESYVLDKNISEETLASWKSNNAVPYKKLAKDILASSANISEYTKNLLVDFAKNFTYADDEDYLHGHPFVVVVNAVDQGIAGALVEYEDRKEQANRPKRKVVTRQIPDDGIFYITYNDILDVLEDFAKEDIEELANMEIDAADDWIYPYIDVPGFNGEGEVDNIDHIGRAAIEIANDMLRGKTIKTLRRKYGKDEI